MNRIALLALALFALFALAINAIVVTDDWWVIALTVLAAIVVFWVIGQDVRHLMDEDADEPRQRPAPRYDGAPLQPGEAFTGESGDQRAVVVATQPMTADEVLPALGVAEASERVSVMVVAPKAIGHHVAVDDDRYYALAREAEGETVAALRGAGVHAAGHVGDHDATQAITDALALFPAPRVVIMAAGNEAATLREHVDVDGLARRTGASVQFVDLSVGRSS